MKVKRCFTGKIAIYLQVSQTILYHCAMRTIIDYIEEVKSRYNLTTYQKTMEFLDMSKQQWTHIQKGGGVKEKNAIRIGQAIGVDPLEIMAVSMSLQAKNKESRDMWLRMIKIIENQKLK